MLFHQSAQSRAIALIIIFLQRARGEAVEPEHMRHKQRDALVDLRPQIAGGRIERIVEIEDPCVDMGEPRPRLCGQQRESRLSVEIEIWRLSRNDPYLVIRVPAP